ncbi:zinc transporter ZIP10-like isoform X3 [Dreissena polymorpha]|uniref:zinc transporter ZIP10-like isoform X3 n=1 Tax=Dreissena polymorpha TaxID=45954 RepID=UPI002263E23F|nr:zinc transporter ZIP10-like isoform X3 [Dreissena polymorpha]
MDLRIKVFRMCNPSSAKTCFICLLVFCLSFGIFGLEGDHHDDHFHGDIEPHVEKEIPTSSEAPNNVYPMEPDFFLQKLLEKYGNGVEMSSEGFFHLLCHLGIGGSFVLSSNASHCTDHSHQYSPLKNGSSFHDHNDHEIHEHSNDTADHDHDHHDHDHDHELHEGHEHVNESQNNDQKHENHDHSLDMAPANIHKGHEHDHENHDHSEYDVPENNKQVVTTLKTTLEKTTVSTTITSTTTIGSTRNKAGKTNKKQKMSTAMPTTKAGSRSQNAKSERKRRAESSQCLEANTMLRLINADPTGGIKGDYFKDLCPVLIYQIETDACHTLHKDDGHQHHEKGKDDHNHDHDHDHDHEHDHDLAHKDALAPSVSFAQIPAKVWGFSCVAVVIISLVGLLGVAVIPIMQKVFYNHLLQILVALAVGALSGDALLHLLPHAMAGGHEGENGHDHSSHGNSESHAHDLGPIYKGLCGLLGIFFFFIIERVLTIVTDIKRRRKKQKNQKRKYLKEPKDDVEYVGERLATTDMCDAMMINIHPNRDGDPEIYLMSQSALQGYADEAHSEHCQISFENTQDVTHEHTAHEHNLTERETNVDGDENATMIHDGNNVHKKHSHGHGHSHGSDGIPTSVTAVAMMVIMGDGVHNFCDGLAIGAAFASSIAGGFSTTIAVFCHELPHEIGDFAMLLRAGMSVKQAVFYNCVSSILCFIGMVIGVAIGNVAGASLWIFTVVAGMFLYIALVDMLPELSSVETKKGENPFFHLLLQFLGMMLGGGIMFVIAIFEADLKTLLE